MEKPVVYRRYDLDWLRVFAVLVVYIFHSGRFFDQMDWHVKNPTRYESMQIWTMFLATWMMPLIFVISGASLFFALGKVGKFVKDKVLRLLVPLIIGVFTHISLCIYLERITHHQYSGSFFAFYPHYFEGWYGFGGNFAWMGLHLWYLLILFVFSLVLLPLFYWLKGPGKKFLKGVGDLFGRPGMVYLLAAPIAWIMIEIRQSSPLGERAWGGWSLPGYIPFFIYGYLIISQEGIQKRLKSWRFVSLGLTLFATIALVYAYERYGHAAYGTGGYALLNGLFSLTAWLWVLAIFGFGMQHLNVQKPFLSYANEAVLPFYILHQPVLLCVGYYVTRWHIPDPAKFLLVSSSSFIILLLVYEFLIRRVNFLRVLFGMKPRQLESAGELAVKVPAPV